MRDKPSAFSDEAEEPAALEGPAGGVYQTAMAEGGGGGADAQGAPHPNGDDVNGGDTDVPPITLELPPQQDVHEDQLVGAEAVPPAKVKVDTATKAVKPGAATLRARVAARRPPPRRKP
tara:strand:+ start:334 stop:690 length:357 start_codon:yes stop_codon:yes gene_type:complete